MRWAMRSAAHAVRAKTRAKIKTAVTYQGMDIPRGIDPKTNEQEADSSAAAALIAAA